MPFLIYLIVDPSSMISLLLLPPINEIFTSDLSILAFHRHKSAISLYGHPYAVLLWNLLIYWKMTVAHLPHSFLIDMKWNSFFSKLHKKEKKKTRPDTRLPQSRAGGQGLYFRSLNHLGRSGEAKDRKNQKKVKCDGRTDGRTDRQSGL